MDTHCVKSLATCFHHTHKNKIRNENHNCMRNTRGQMGLLIGLGYASPPRVEHNYLYLLKVREVEKGAFVNIFFVVYLNLTPRWT